MPAISPRVLLALVAVASLSADQKKLTEDQRLEIVRGLSAEYATVKAPLPQSKKPLDIDPDGNVDPLAWSQATKQFGPAARVGDLVQVTRVSVEKDSIILEINNGMRGHGSWKDHVQISGPISGSSRPMNSDSNAPGGTTIGLRFKGPIGEITSAEVKKMLRPVLDFNQHSATEQYTEVLLPEIKKAIADKKPVEGMDRDEILLAMGRPVRKTRETKDGVEYEDWIYGIPPGRVTFVTFAGAKVVKIKETYAGLGGTIAGTPQQP